MIVVLRPVLDGAEPSRSSVDLGPEDRVYLATITHPARAREAFCARAALVDALALHDAVKPWRLTRGPWGAPILQPMQGVGQANDASPPPNSADFAHTAASLSSPVPPFTAHVSLAHSEKMAAAAVGGARCGVDVEALDRDRIHGAWKRLATAREQAWALTLPPADRARYIVRAWTFKECWAKIMGDGLAKRGPELEVEALPGGHLRIHSAARVHAFTAISQGHTLALLVEGPASPAEIRGSELEWTQLEVVRAAQPDGQ